MLHYVYEERIVITRLDRVIEVSLSILFYFMLQGYHPSTSLTLQIPPDLKISDYSKNNQRD